MQQKSREFNLATPQNHSMCSEAQLWLNWLGTTRFYQVYQTDSARTERLKVAKLIRFTKRTVGYPGPSTNVPRRRGGFLLLALLAVPFLLGGAYSSTRLARDLTT